MNMYVCLCNGITERSVRQAAAEGVCSLSELTHRTGCAGSCGSCADLAEQILCDERQRQAFSLPISAAA
ncbi:MAG TPA: (2Fe-2S)-binding protein [Rudaea sp.]|nr:(2Fe-2S)-binding protein [Rudaea sp.]